MDEVRASAPWPIPEGTKRINEEKDHYRQIKYVWHDGDWRYEARWHTPVPGARIVDYPSWRLDRLKAGKGFGADHAPRVSETRVGDHWVPTRKVRYAAKHVQNGIASIEEVNMIRQAHWRDES